MSEYWKSTPKYWCKHCKTYIRDTKLEKTNHEATPKHQGNLKRFLRDLHRGHEKEEKDKERAKSEVARLNGLVPAGSTGSVASSSNSGFGRGPTPSIPKPQATAAQRKQQLAQLAEMGVTIPDEFRPDMAMAGEWQVTSERIIGTDDTEKDPESVALGVRKRVLEEDELEAAEAKKKRWGNAYRTHPTNEGNEDLDALLSNVTRKGRGAEIKPETGGGLKVELQGEMKEDFKEDIKSEPESVESRNKALGTVTILDERPQLKEEPSEGYSAIPSTIPSLTVDVKHEGEEPSIPGVVFKKRKTKNIRQR